MKLSLKRNFLTTIKVLFLFLVLIIVATTIIIKSSGDNDFQSPLNQNVVNDVTALNPINVSKIIEPETTDDIIKAIKTSRGQISIGGGRYSMGGQTASQDSLHIDMRKYNKVIKLDHENKLITVQTGITWRDIQEAIDPYDLSVKIMQTYSNFTVGGSLSVNVHGRYIGEGPLIHSVKSIQLVLADGSLKSASPEENSELFYAAIGGYGGVGVITEATLKLAVNSKIERIATRLSVSEYKEHFFTNVRNNKNVVFHNADLYPPDYKDALDISWYKTDKELTDKTRIIPRNEEYYWGPLATELVAEYDIGKSIRKYIIDPIYYAYDRVVWRNWEASYDVRELEPENRIETTYVLREYFIPVEHFDEFIPLMRDIFQKNNVNILNVSVRHAYKDSGSLLAWARRESFAFVVYYRQGTDRKSKSAVEKWSKEMIDVVISFDGSHYLPYQIIATPEQFLSAYPRSPEFFKVKQKYDPENRFTNQLWNHYYSNDNKASSNKATIKNYYRDEEQTFLTIPEWYLVFNPVEYADFLEAGNNPSDFPFFDSIDEYWTLYDRVTLITKDIYPQNSEYITMLQVIGISTTVEYMLKSAYENTFGRFTSWTASDENTKEDVIIQQAARAYSDFIFDVAWYEFDFSSWIKTIWIETDFFGDNFIRKLERKIFFTLEYGLKTIYAKMIEFGAKNTYEQSDGLIYASVVNSEYSSLLPEKVKIIDENSTSRVISIPRWGDFTRALPLMADANFDFIDISGNSKIAMTLIVPQEEMVVMSNALTLFDSRVVSDKLLKRIAVLTNVSDLTETIIEARNKGYKLEHIYDY